MNPGDPLHEACEEIARTATRALRGLVDELLTDGLPDLKREQLLLIAGHEFIWNLAEQLCRLGHLTEPGAMLDEAANYADLKALTFIRSHS